MFDFILLDEAHSVSEIDYRKRFCWLFEAHARFLVTDGKASGDVRWE